MLLVVSMHIVDREFMFRNWLKAYVFSRRNFHIMSWSRSNIGMTLAELPGVIEHYLKRNLLLPSWLIKRYALDQLIRAARGHDMMFQGKILNTGISQ